MTYEKCFRKGKAALAKAGIREAELDARLLLEYICQTNRNDLLVHGDREVDAVEERHYSELIAKRAERVPLQHLTGVQEFMGLEFAVNRHVLIPRQDTEILVEEVLKSLQDGSRILDMCTGSGCILISLLHYSNNCEGIGADISREALELAQLNAKKHGSRAQFVQSDLFEQVTGQFDIIVSNPPYIPSNVIETLMPEVREHEPLQALDGCDDGLFFYRQIISDSKDRLNGGGRLYFEIGYDQGEAVCGLMERAEFKEVSVVKDYAGLDRVVFGTRQVFI